tara:strand:+ start:29155 stop:29523 length:369 start_codon:yes stop_codon:yes gene_type:complete
MNIAPITKYGLYEMLGVDADGNVRDDMALNAAVLSPYLSQPTDGAMVGGDSRNEGFYYHKDGGLRLLMETDRAPDFADLFGDAPFIILQFPHPEFPRRADISDMPVFRAETWDDAFTIWAAP